MDFQVNSTYSFKVYAPNILTSDFSNVVVLGVLSYSIANKFEDITAMHAQVFNQLPAGSIDQPTKYQYLQIRFPTGDEAVIGIPWIKPDTIVQVAISTIRVDIGNASASDVTKIRNCLVQNGFNNLNISIL